jgi:membrane fusion protein (multidrug efflux system)
MQTNSASPARSQPVALEPSTNPSISDKDSSVAPQSSQVPPEKRKLRSILFAVGPVLAIVLGATLYFTSGRYVETENAYVKSNKVTISAEVAGPIVAVAVRENQSVKKGDELFRIDAAPLQIALDRANAQLRTEQAEVEGLKANYRQTQEQLRIAQTNANFMQRELERQAQLAKQHLVSQVKLDEAQHNFDNAKQQIVVMEQQAAQTLAQLAGNANISPTQHPRYLDAQAARDDASLNLQRAVAYAPFAGITTKVPQIGQYMNIGGAVMSVIATDAMWVEANFPETDLTHVRSGQAVTIRLDTYPDREWQGTVQSIAQATGAEFSVLPPQNATANWVKVAQRIPVRIAIKAAANDPPLRMGMTAFVKIDTGAHHTVRSLLHLQAKAD